MYYSPRAIFFSATWVKVILPALKVVPLPEQSPKRLNSLLEWTRISDRNERNLNSKRVESETSELEEMLKQYEVEIDQKLEELKIPVETMKKVPLTFPFLPVPLIP